MERVVAVDRFPRDLPRMGNFRRSSGSWILPRRYSNRICGAVSRRCSPITAAALLPSTFTAQIRTMEFADDRAVRHGDSGCSRSRPQLVKGDLARNVLAARLGTRGNRGDVTHSVEARRSYFSSSTATLFAPRCAIELF